MVYRAIVVFILVAAAGVLLVPRLGPLFKNSAQMPERDLSDAYHDRAIGRIAATRPRGNGSVAIPPENT